MIIQNLRRNSKIAHNHYSNAIPTFIALFKTIKREEEDTYVKNAKRQRNTLFNKAFKN